MPVRRWMMEFYLKNSVKSLYSSSYWHMVHVHRSDFASTTCHVHTTTFSYLIPQYHRTPVSLFGLPAQRLSGRSITCFTGGRPTYQAKLRKAWLSHQGRPSPGGLQGAPLSSSSACFWLACTQVGLPRALRCNSNGVHANSWRV
jgi:hypothetical protein